MTTKLPSLKQLHTNVWAEALRIELRRIEARHLEGHRNTRLLALRKKLKSLRSR